MIVAEKTKTTASKSAGKGAKATKTASKSSTASSTKSKTPTKAKATKATTAAAKSAPKSKAATKATTAAAKSAPKKARKAAAKPAPKSKTATKGKTSKAAARPAPKSAAAKSKPTTAAAKSAPKSGAAKSSSAASAAKQTSAAVSSARSSSSKAPFKVGDKVVYPHHGAATIIKKEKNEFGGESHDYYVLEVATDQLTVRVPVSRALDLGVRPVISTTVAKKVFATFRDEPQEAGSNWSRWYKLLTEKINSGDIFQVAEVVRDLTYAQQVKGISPALKRMLAKARLIIISELRFALQLDEEEAIKKLDRALPKVEVPVEA